MVSLDANKVREQLKALKNLPNFKEVVNLRKRLQSELKILDAKEESKIEVIEFPKVTRAKKISRAMQKYHNYLRAIRNNFPDLSYADIRKAYSQKRKGLQSKVPDAVFENPSPNIE